MGGGGVRGPLHNIYGHRGAKMSANSALIRVEMYVQQAKTIETSFSYMGQSVKKCIVFGYLRGSGAPSMIRLGLY